MTQEEKIHQLESKLTALERQMDFISKRFGLLPDQDEFDRAMEALMARDPEPLDDYIKRGGKIPTTDCHCEPNYARRGNLTNGASL